MKVPFSFGLKLVFRWLAPGLVLAVAFFPLAHWLNTFLSLPISVEVYLTVATLVLGWLVMLFDMPIYMLYEGRRWWPGWLYRWGTQREQERLERLQKEPENIEKLIDTLQFPLSRDRAREATAPTRLGNLLAECEDYPRLKYGLDGVFYWYRLWFYLDKDTRGDIDDVQSLADGALYISFASLVGFALSLAYAVVQLSTDIVFYPAFGASFYILIAVLFFIAFYLVYRVSLYAQDHYAELFKAVFDTNGTRWDPDPVVNILEELTGEHTLRRLSRRDKNLAAWRFLRFDRYKTPSDPKSREIGELLDEKAKRVAAPRKPGTRAFKGKSR